jgi:carbon monoxide dehydrogenase subunit G
MVGSSDTEAPCPPSIRRKIMSNTAGSTELRTADHRGAAGAPTRRRRVPVEVAHSIDIDAPASAVWELASDIRRYADWVDATDAVVGGDLVAVPGASYVEESVVVGPLKARSSWVVLEADPDRGRQVHRSDDVAGVGPVFVTMRITPVGERTTFTLELTAHPARLLSPLVRRVLTRGNQRSVEAFAALVDAELTAAR